MTHPYLSKKQNKTRCLYCQHSNKRSNSGAERRMVELKCNVGKRWCNSQKSPVEFQALPLMFRLKLNNIKLPVNVYGNILYVLLNQYYEDICF